MSEAAYVYQNHSITLPTRLLHAGGAAIVSVVPRCPDFGLRSQGERRNRRVQRKFAGTHVAYVDGKIMYT